MNKMNKKGFTLIEMLVVIAIIAVLVAIIVPTVQNSTMKAKGAADAANIRSLAAEAAIESMDKGTSGAMTMPFESKVYGASGTITFTEQSGAMVASINVGNKTGLTLEHFAKIAESGIK